MIKEDTVLILGAGSSNPYKYPTSQELKKHICANKTHFFDLMSSQLRLQAEDLINNFQKSPTTSIDLFVSRNPEYLLAAKIIIMDSLISFESGSAANKVWENDHWHSLLFNKMTEAIQDPADIDLFKSNSIRFLTFNYDRSLENMFYEYVRHSFPRLSREEVVEAAASVRVHHVYGSIAPLPWQDSKIGVSYGAEHEKFDWREENIKKQIKLIGEERSERSISEEVKKFIGNPKKICFLGFSYADENLKILGLPSLIESNRELKIYGTALGLSPVQIERLKEKISAGSMNIFDDSVVPIFASYGCVGVLKDYL